MTPTIIIIRGNSGSGKSTIAKELQKRLGYGTMLISQDVIRREIMYVKDRPNNKAVDLLQSMIAFAFEKCKISILEGILYSDIYENLFSFIQRTYVKNIHAYYFDLTFEETINRHLQKPTANDYGEAEMRMWWREKDYLPNIPEKLLKEDMKKGDIVDLILNDLKSDRCG
ncbi:MAG: AAA family ATPase [Defluviitaleaceae bacterium]|nr:AAA family ATPase [Defluviitaleaceae bacterium]